MRPESLCRSRDLSSKPSWQQPSILNRVGSTSDLSPRQNIRRTRFCRSQRDVGPISAWVLSSYMPPRRKCAPAFGADATSIVTSVKLPFQRDSFVIMLQTLEIYNPSSLFQLPLKFYKLQKNSNLVLSTLIFFFKIINNILKVLTFDMTCSVRASMFGELRSVIVFLNFY